ncbi:unnamed protein product [Dracunculus medinensis]|uniref:C2H2-type domain-containing protein n=1 Tax=Dracunculus medinensis TaxID=318479 RepID=A0A158Q2Z8_DRAME|nr:unnamed protein product [Dracunculus medinensis]
MEIDIKNEETSADQEKNIDELRSPSPSESVNNTDLVYSCNDLTNADKPYTCMHTNCHKRFANKFLLKKHQFIHTGLRPHRCPFCGKRFNRKDNLLRHKKTHIANALAPDINELSGEDFLLQMNSDKPLLQLNNEADQEEDL